MQGHRQPRFHNKSSTEPYLGNNLEKEIGSKKILALDLDETLIHCETKVFEGAGAFTQVTLHGRNLTLYISKRPGLEEFLERMSKCFTLYLYTSGIKEYAEALLKFLKIEDYFSLVFHRKHCRLTSEGKFEKNLALLGVDPKDIILVDDALIHVENQPLNILVVRPFVNDKQDNQLPLITNFLEKLATQSDVRPVMPTYIQYKDEISSQSIFVKAATLTRSLKAKFMKDLKPLTDSQDLSTQSDFRGIDENLDGNMLEKKLLLVKTLITSPSRKMRDDSPTRFKKPLIQRTMKPSLEDSNNLFWFETLSPRITEISSSGDIAETPPVMLPQSHSTKFKLRSIELKY